jgi:formate-dependent nitrite reductase cytochrome c552 subunit
MSKNLDLKYYKIEVNDENKETKCTLKVICKQFLTQAKKKTLLEFFLKY